MGNIPEEGPVLLVGNHSGGNLTPDTTVLTLPSAPSSGSSGGSTSWPTTSCSRCRASASCAVGHRGRVAGERREALRAARPCCYPGGDWRSIARLASAVDFGGRRASSASRSRTTCRSCPSSPSAGRRPRSSSAAASALQAPQPRSAVPPEGPADLPRDAVGHQRRRLPRPRPAAGQDHHRGPPGIHLRREFGHEPDVDEAYDHVMRVMQDTLDALSAERRLPIMDELSAKIEITRRPSACGRRSSTPRAAPLHGRHDPLGGPGKQAPGSARATARSMRVGSAEVGSLVEIVSGTRLGWPRRGSPASASAPAGGCAPAGTGRLHVEFRLAYGWAPASSAGPPSGRRPAGPRNLRRSLQRPIARSSTALRRPPRAAQRHRASPGAGAGPSPSGS